MQKYAITSLIMATIAIPAMATNDLVTETNNGCDNTTLNTYDGDVNLTADWSANTINLTWYNDSAENGGEVHSNTQCTYNSGITLPTAPTRNGYTFGGWRVRQCSLSQYYQATSGTDYGYINDTAHASYPGSYNDDIYELTEDNTWATEFAGGVIKGRAICSGKPGNNHNWQWDGNSVDWTATESELLSASGEKKYCWCAGTDFGNLCHVASTLWIFDNDEGSVGDCASFCASYCGMNVGGGTPAFRRAIFGVPAE